MTTEHPNPALAQFQPLIGEWTLEAPAFPGATGRAVVAWIESGRYLALRTSAPDPAPDSTQLIGADEATTDCTILYWDQRGVSRVYQTSLADGVWRIWRHAPRFHQRFAARVEDGGTVLRGAWEASDDGETWRHDFDLIYRR